MSKLARKFARRRINCIPSYLKEHFEYKGRAYVCVRERHIYEEGKKTAVAYIKKCPTTGYYMTQQHGFWHTAKTLQRVIAIVEHCSNNFAKVPARMWVPSTSDNMELDMAMM